MTKIDMTYDDAIRIVWALQYRKDQCREQGSEAQRFDLLAQKMAKVAMELLDDRNVEIGK